MHKCKMLVHMIAVYYNTVQALPTGCTGMQIHIRPDAGGDKNYVRAIVNQHVTSPAGD